jgi:ribosome maturation factor RimP
VGESARVETAAPEASRIAYTGHIRSCINGLLTLDTPEGEVAIELSSIAKASLVDREYKIDKKMKRERRARRAQERKGDRT